jgi:hypothetical protein
MKATIQRKFYVTDAEDTEIRKKCATAGISVSRAAAELFQHWQPNRTVHAARRHRPTYGHSLGLPGRACLRL